MKPKGPTEVKSLEFAIDIVELYKRLNRNREWVLSKQTLRSGTAIGPLIKESEHSESKKDFVHKLSIALKEANETNYWLELLWKTDYISKREFIKHIEKVDELKRLLISTIKTTKERYL
mgnify:CR=1 FL=1